MKRILEASHIIDGGALLHGERGDWGFRFSHSTVDASQDATDEARAALGWVAGYCATNSEAIVLNPGDLLWVNNRRAIHGRGEVGSDVGGQERWLLRTYGIRPQLLEADQRYIARPFQLFP